MELEPIVPDPLTLRPMPTATLVQRRGSHAMQQPPNDPAPKPGSQDGEQSDGKVLQFTAQRRMEPERKPNPPMPDDDDDPGPSAA